MVGQTSPAGFAPAGAVRVSSMNIARTELCRAFTGDRRDDARVEELDNLRLALATFALQLDVFEMRASESLKAHATPEISAAARDAGCRLQKDKVTGGQ
jgi:hypothetical protein